MRIESTEFTDADYDAFIADYFELSRRDLLARLRRIVEETERLLPGVERADDAAPEEWNPREVLAHMATSTQFFGWAIHEVVSGKDVGGQMAELMKLRDPTIVEAVASAPADLVQQLREGIDRLVAFLQDTPYEDLRRRIPFASKELSAEDFARLSVVYHLEDHLEQIRTALGR